MFASAIEVLQFTTRLHATA